MKNKKIFHIFLYVLSAIVLLIGSCFITYKLFSKSDPFKDKNNKDVIAVGVFDDGTYYISKAEKNIKFKVQKSKNDSYKLVDLDGNSVASKIVKNGSNYYIQADKPYKEGNTYFLELTDNKFVDKVFSQSNKIEFKIEEKEKGKYKFNNAVKETRVSDIKVVSEDNLIIPNNKYKPNEIILVKDNKNNISDAFKVKEVNGDSLIVEKPQVAEIYDDIDLYQEGIIDFGKIDVNDNLEANIKKQVKSSSLFQYLAKEVYAEDVEPKIELSFNNEKIKIDISIKFKAKGKPLMGIEALDKHDLIIHFSYEMSAKYEAKVDKGVNIAFDTAIADTYSFEIELKNGDEYLKGIEEISDAEYSKTVQDIVKKLQKEVPDVSENSVDIGAVEVPTSVPGINVFIDIYFQCQLSVEVNLDFKYSTTKVQHFGFVINKNEKKAYQNVTHGNNNFEFSIVGKEEIRVGVGLNVGVSFISKDLASASMGGELGVYQEAFSTFKMQGSPKQKTFSSNLVGKLELGIYLKLKVKANIDMLFFKEEISLDLAEAKAPVLTLGNSEIIEDIEPVSSVLAIGSNNKVKIPTINKVLVDLSNSNSRKEPIDANLIAFEDKDGNPLDFDGNYVDVKKNEEMSIFAVYKEFLRVYKAEITVLKQGSSVSDMQSSGSNTSGSNGVSGNKVGSISLDKGIKSTDAYKKYILEKKYVDDYRATYKDMEMTGNIYNVGYCVYDIDGNGTPELIISASIEENSSAWLIDNVYTYKDGAVVVIDKIYNYGGISLEANEHAIVYSEVRPTLVTGGYGFYKLVGTSFVHYKTVGHDRGSFIDGQYESDNSFIYYSADNIKQITEEEERAQYNNVADFAYIDINTVR